MLEALISIAKEAGSQILRVYNDEERSAQVEIKNDQSPLTLADQLSNDYILSQLPEVTPGIPIISEEGKDISYEERSAWKDFWLVDPLDGTKEFINRNGEFTVNIARIQEGVPVAGIIYVPVKDVLYYGIEGKAWKSENGELTEISVRNKEQDRIAVRSRSHPASEEEEVFNRYAVIDYISAGSSLKFCMVAEGKADLYYRHGPTMEWDTAAGQAILEAAGGKMYSGTGPDRFRYNKESLLNGSFLCLGFDQ